MRQFCCLRLYCRCWWNPTTRRDGRDTLWFLCELIPHAVLLYSLSPLSRHFDSHAIRFGLRPCLRPFSFTCCFSIGWNIFLTFCVHPSRQYCAWGHHSAHSTSFKNFPRYSSRPSQQGHLLTEMGFRPLWCSNCGVDWACRKLTRDDFFQLWSLEPWSSQHCSSFQNAVIIWWINQGYLAGMLTWQDNSLAFVPLVYRTQGQWAAASGSNNTAKLQYQDVCEFYTSSDFFFFSSLKILLYFAEVHTLLATFIVASDDIHGVFCPGSIEEMCVFDLWYIFVTNSPVHVSIVV